MPCRSRSPVRATPLVRSTTLPYQAVQAARTPVSPSGTRFNVSPILFETSRNTASDDSSGTLPTRRTGDVMGLFPCGDNGTMLRPRIGALRCLASDLRDQRQGLRGAFVLFAHFHDAGVQIRPALQYMQ